MKGPVSFPFAMLFVGLLVACAALPSAPSSTAPAPTLVDNSVADSPAFAGVSDEFSTLTEFDSLMESTVASGKIDPFWQAVTSTGQMPLVFGDTLAVFLYRSKAWSVECDGDEIITDLNDAYVRQGETDLWMFRKEFESDARIEYQISMDGGEPILDPLNPLTETGGLGTNSVVQMPKYVTPEFTRPRSDIAHGKFSDNILISSVSLHYDVNYRVYTPAGYETMESLPVIYVTDGQDFANPGMGAMVIALDNLIADNRIEPVVAVFVDPRDPVTGKNRRGQELAPLLPDVCKFCDFMAKELVPVIDASHSTDPSPDSRAVLGFSLGGWFTAHMTLAYPDVFHLVGIMSPYIWRDFTFSSYEEAERPPLMKVFLSHGTYDSGAASPRLRDLMEEKDYPLMYVETHAGHSYGNVRGLLDDMLNYFFGKRTNP